jgi:hypothetical protein
MSRFSASVGTTGFALLLVAAAIPAQTQIQTQAQLTLSKVRIVRLSEVRGAVQLDRSVGHGFEPAVVNMPVVQQNSLKTAIGVAEVEFENSSTLRLGPNTEVQFTLLGRTPQGATVSIVHLVRGIAYMSVVNSHAKVANSMDLVFGDQNLQLQPDTHIRLEISGRQAKLAVLKGSVQAEGPTGAVDIARKHTATFALADDTQPNVAKGIPSLALLDRWDKQLDQYHSRVASLSMFGGVPYSYGASDMLYYGSFQNVGGCGMMWRPYFASAAWDPYSNGTWAYYSGAGYSWVSPYPWGWTPYHYGSWSFCQGIGWGWMPGGSWMGLNNIASAGPGASVNAIKGPGRLPVAPHPPRAGGPSLLSVNRTASVHSGLDARGAFVFRKDSAGLGIPRNELGNLRGFSRNADRRGMATTPIYINTQPRASNGMRGMRNAPAPIAMHRGYAPSNGGFPSARASGNMGSAAGNARGNSAPMQSVPSMRSAPAAPAGRGPR